MNSSEFWCRAFLSAMDPSYARDVTWENHGAPAAYCEKAADAALAVAQRRGMVAGERAIACRTIALPEPDDRPCTPDELRQLRRVAQIACAWACGGHDGERVLREAVSEWWHAEGARLDAAMRAEKPEAPVPKLERVEFTAERHGDLWELHGPELGGYGIQVLSGRETCHMGGDVVRIKWAEAPPPKPIDVWIERGG